MTAATDRRQPGWYRRNRVWLLALITMLLLWLLLYLTVPAAQHLGLPAARSRTVVIVAIAGFARCVFS